MLRHAERMHEIVDAELCLPYKPSMYKLNDRRKLLCWNDCP